MNDRTALLEAIRRREVSDRYGIGLAAQYLKGLSGCFDGGYCPRAMSGVSGEEWAGALKDAERKFVYCEKGMNVKGVFESTETNVLCEFECVVTSTRKDRDGDRLLTSGATLDPMAPLLWQHDPFHPIGKVLRRTSQTNDKMGARCCILDFGDSDGELAKISRDANILVRANALRISHGFEPQDYEPLEEKDGRYRINKFEILEVSLVSIPSNTDAIITAFSNKKLHSALIKGYAEGLYRARPVQVPGANLRSTEKHDCKCHEKDAAAHRHGTYRHEGESMQDCVSRKIEINRNEHPEWSPAQAEAVSYAECGEHGKRFHPIGQESIDGGDTAILLEEVVS